MPQQHHVSASQGLQPTPMSHVMMHSSSFHACSCQAQVPFSVVKGLLRCIVFGSWRGWHKSSPMQPERVYQVPGRWQLAAMEASLIHPAPHKPGVVSFTGQACHYLISEGAHLSSCTLVCDSLRLPGLLEISAEIQTT